MASPSPSNKFQKGNKLGRKPGQPNLMTKDIKTLLREVGFIQRVREHIRAARRRRQKLVPHFLFR